ncbi:hypothetical protein PFISCL1PPCAC_2227, partial [Pristionchus fissidentatus]
IMRLLILIALTLVSAAVGIQTYSGTCRYDNSMVYETGYDPRPMTNSERNQMLNYESQWTQYGVQTGQYWRGQNSMPTPPRIPCFCRNCQ